MHFSSSSGICTLSPSAGARESVDPIAELLSQLSGVRRSGGTHSSQQLQQLQMQIQMERQQVMVSEDGEMEAGPGQAGPFPSLFLQTPAPSPH